MKERFEGPEGKRRLIAALQGQKACKSEVAIGEALAESCEVAEFSAGEVLITEGAADTDVYFIISGSFSIIVKGQVVAKRAAGDSVGEMSAIEPTIPRSATVVADDTCVVAKVSEENFVRIANQYPILWRSIAQELSKRLLQRNSLINKPNDHPRLFIISSKEALHVAQEIASQLAHDVHPVLWTGVFFASSYALEALEKAVDESDFAIAIAQPDDTTTSRGVESKTARDNVIFELGLFMGRLSRARTILFQPQGQELKLPSDLNGLVAVTYPVGDRKNLTSLLTAPCHEVRKLVQKLGVRK